MDSESDVAGSVGSALAAAGSAATLRLWRKGEGGHTSETLWEKDFGGQFSRMRDIEVGDIDGNGTNVMAVATHDQGVVAVVEQPPGRSDRQAQGLDQLLVLFFFDGLVLVVFLDRRRFLLVLIYIFFLYLAVLYVFGLQGCRWLLVGVVIGYVRESLLVS